MAAIRLGCERLRKVLLAPHTRAAHSPLHCCLYMLCSMHFSHLRAECACGASGCGARLSA